MEKLMKKYRDLSFRRAFVLTVLAAFAAVAFLSAAGIWGCVAFRNYLVPDPNAVMLKIEYQNEKGRTCSAEYRVTLGEEAFQVPWITEAEDGEPVPELADISSLKVSAVKLGKSIDLIGPRRRLAYRILGVLTALLPLLFSVAGILVCGFFFYRHKMKEPLALLNRAMENITSENLDFSLKYESRDEMGQLCGSFEKMRGVLSENYRTLWNMAQERRLLQASVAHDLRNPIAILAGYAEYLRIGLEKGTLSGERLLTIAGRMEDTAGRLSQYTESVRYLNRMEDVELHPVPVNAPEFVRKMTEDFEILAKEADLRLEAVCRLQEKETEGSCEQTVTMDCDVVYRIAENLMNNALRFARQTVKIVFDLEEESPTAGKRFFTVEICDDGPGFPEELLGRKSDFFAHASGEREHSGLGLAIADILCKKHGGRLELSNSGEGLSGGAAKLFIKS